MSGFAQWFVGQIPSAAEVVQCHEDLPHRKLHGKIEEDCFDITCSIKHRS